MKHYKSKIISYLVKLAQQKFINTYDKLSNLRADGLNKNSYIMNVYGGFCRLTAFSHTKTSVRTGNKIYSVAECYADYIYLFLLKHRHTTRFHEMVCAKNSRVAASADCFLLRSRKHSFYTLVSDTRPIGGVCV